MRSDIPRAAAWRPLLFASHPPIMRSLMVLAIALFDVLTVAGPDGATNRPVTCASKR
jgi:hypothetical protein